MELKEILIFMLACVLSYLLGGVSIARFITGKEKGGDIKSQGSGNPGTMNMLRTHGIVMGLFTLFCDALKGVIPALFGLLYFGQFDTQWGYMALYVLGFCAVLGHIYPIYYKFKGGKGIATTFGVFMVADPISTLILFGILFVVLYVIKIGSVVSLLMITINAIIQLFKDAMAENWVAIVFMWVMVILDIYAHRTNLKRLIENKENPADLQEGLKKDLEKIRVKRERKLEKNAEKQEKIEQKFDRKINKRSEKVQRKIDRFNEKNSREDSADDKNASVAEDESSESVSDDLASAEEVDKKFESSEE